MSSLPPQLLSVKCFSSLVTRLCLTHALVVSLYCIDLDYHMHVIGVCISIIGVASYTSFLEIFVLDLGFSATLLMEL